MYGVLSSFKQFFLGGVKIRQLTPEDAASFRSLRLAALQETPTAFGSSYEEEKDFPLAVVQDRLAAGRDHAVFGAFDNSQLIGVAGLGRESMRKLAHKGFIWGMYVAPQARGHGVGRALLQAAIARARANPDICYVNVSVNADNAGGMKLYESAGFVSYGREPEVLVVDGKFYDEVRMGLQLRQVSSLQGK
ncbi:hypothetical protein PATSB16_19500 [Pandoraea thiooxydans]|uniref:N-acetyltransferase domain-containing protein n=1 Tax=Pandoraea thiooxydans TaxID=445709 RepID=A0A0G3EPV4_9BURK|nr:GNAT family N-acetyltransferase [Pandoraea thiooxydans]AKJ68044.1 hypothetical protein ABW99_07295 [Pandoraea thiooxydans]APR95290.1 hypothetical protein PATSB16_19500 [Pandoraea thiooxydans]